MDIFQSPSSTSFGTHHETHLPLLRTDSEPRRSVAADEAAGGSGISGNRAVGDASASLSGRRLAARRGRKPDAGRLVSFRLVVRPRKAVPRVAGPSDPREGR